jgi:hypothetical protein
MKTIGVGVLGAVAAVLGGEVVNSGDYSPATAEGWKHIGEMALFGALVPALASLRKFSSEEQQKEAT